MSPPLRFTEAKFHMIVHLVRLGVFIILAASLWLGCDQSFDPLAPNANLPVVYSILATDRSTQYVRVYSVGSSPNANAGEIAITNAQVTLTNGSTTWSLRDTLIPRADTSRYTNPVFCYYSSDQPIENEKQYTLSIQAPFREILSAVVTIPSQPFLLINDTSMLYGPVPPPYSRYWPDEDWTLTFNSFHHENAKGYWLRFLVDYEILRGGEWQQRRIEVPIRYQPSEGLITALYSTLTKFESSVVVRTYGSQEYAAVIMDAWNREPKIVFRRVVFQLVLVEENLYNYYTVTNGFTDPFTLRLDRPNFSNIENGTGLFGAYSVDSLVYLLPKDFLFNKP